MSMVPLAAARALAAGLSPQEISELTGYQVHIVERWEDRVAVLLDRWRSRGRRASQYSPP